MRDKGASYGNQTEERGVRMQGKVECGCGCVRHVINKKNAHNGTLHNIRTVVLIEARHAVPPHQASSAGRNETPLQLRQHFPSGRSSPLPCITRECSWTFPLTLPLSEGSPVPIIKSVPRLHPNRVLG
jgi:hypothetical protein